MGHRVSDLIKNERYALAFVRWYIAKCKKQSVPCDGKSYDLPDAYADWVESKR